MAHELGRLAEGGSNLDQLAGLAGAVHAVLALDRVLDVAQALLWTSPATSVLLARWSGSPARPWSAHWSR